MSDQDLTVAPSQPSGERTKLALIWVAFAVVCLLVVLFSLPYAMEQQSPIMVKTEVLIKIVSGRRTHHKWPVDENDKTFAFGELAGSEPVRPSFKFLGSKPDDKDPHIDWGLYEMTFRGKTFRIKARFNPNEKPKGLF